MPSTRLLAAALAVVAVAAGTSAAMAAPVVTTTNAISSSFADTAHGEFTGANPPPVATFDYLKFYESR